MTSDSFMLNNKNDKLTSDDVQNYWIETPGGQLKVSFREINQNRFTDLFLEGPAMHVFDGVISL